MTRIYALAVALLVASCARDRVAYLDLDRAVNECDEGKRLAAISKAELDAKAKELVNDAPAWQAFQQELSARTGRQAQEIVRRMGTVVARVAVARQLTTVERSPLYVAPGLDLTDEVVRRYNAGDGREEDEIAALKAKLSALERQNGQKQ